MFKCEICDPLIEGGVDRGVIPAERVLPAFREFPWVEMLAKMKTAEEEAIHSSPTIAFTHVSDGHGLAISIVEDKEETVFYLFYNESDDSRALDLLDQTAEATTVVLEDFVAGHYDRVLEKFRPKRSWKFWK